MLPFLEHFLFCTLRAAPCGPPLAGHPLRAAFAKRIAPRIAVRRTNLFLSGRFITLLLLGLHPKPALLFFHCKKDPAGRLAKRLAPEPPSAGQIYFYTVILQLPTVGQVKCLYTPLKINFIDGFKGVRLTAKDKSEQQRQKQRGKRRFILCRAEQYKSKCW